MSTLSSSDELIELAINLIKNQTNFPFDLEEIIGEYNAIHIDEVEELLAGNLDFEKIKGLLLQNNIVYNIFIEKSNKFNVTDQYRDIINKGGWKNYIEYQKYL